MENPEGVSLHPWEEIVVLGTWLVWEDGGEDEEECLLEASCIGITMLLGMKEKGGSWKWRLLQDAWLMFLFNKLILLLIV